MSARRNNGKQGNAALWIILVIFALGNPIFGIFFLLVAGFVWYAKKNLAAKDADPDQPAQRQRPTEAQRRQNASSAASPSAFRPKKKAAVSTPVRTPSRPTRPSAQQHDHIPSICLDQKARLEQLETLKKAGLYSNEEYKAKREEILRSKG